MANPNYRLKATDKTVKTYRERPAGAPEAWVKMLHEVTALETADETRALGDTLPIGLRLHH